MAGLSLICIQSANFSCGKCQPNPLKDYQNQLKPDEKDDRDKHYRDASQSETA
jgi:hypothetical protein